MCQLFSHHFKAGLTTILRERAVSRMDASASTLIIFFRQVGVLHSCRCHCVCGLLRLVPWSPLASSAVDYYIDMNEIYQHLLERNARETIPFLPIYEANASLLNLTDTLQSKCAAAEREVAALRQELQDSAAMGKGGAKGMSLNNAAMKSALKNETRLRDKLELLQEEYNAKLKAESEVQSEALKTANKLQEVQTLNAAQDRTIMDLKEEIERGAEALTRLQQRVNDAEASTRLAEQQYDGLKSKIRSLQEENDNLQKENRVTEGRLVTDKGKLVDEMNVLTDLVERLKKEVDMLRSLKHQQDKRGNGAISSWFTASPKNDTKSSSSSGATGGKEDSAPTRKFGSMGIAIVPSTPQRTIMAHTMEGTCVKYDDSGPNLLATASSDSTVKVWDTVSGSLRGTFRGTSGHSILCCDIMGSLVVGGGSDKTCRVWNLRTERMVCMVPQLLFHARYFYECATRYLRRFITPDMCIVSSLTRLLDPFLRFTNWWVINTKSHVYGYLGATKVYSQDQPTGRSKCGTLVGRPTVKRQPSVTALRRPVSM